MTVTLSIPIYLFSMINAVLEKERMDMQKGIKLVTDYVYDDGGRIVSDETRGITLIGYNNEGHPVRMVLDEGHEFHDAWDNFGNHLSTTIYMMQPSGMLSDLPLAIREYRGDGFIITSTPALGGGREVIRRFAGGYFRNGKVYYHVSDYQGNNVAVVDGDGKIVEQTNYYPYGEPWREATEQPFLYAGNERLRLFGLNEYDFIARRYNPLLVSFTTWDFIAEKYPWLSPYAYCAGNPINYIDRNGLSVHALDEETMQNIRYTLSKKEAEYVRFNNGVLDVDLLNQSESTSQNMTALKALANSVTSYIFQIGDSYTANGETKSMSENGTSGVTLMPNMGDEPSPDGNVYVHLYNRMPEEHQATTTAHEGYGHAYFYELYRKDKSIDPLHRYESEGSIYFDEEFGVYGTTSVRVDKNLKLFEQIKIVTQQALKNYKSFWK